MTIVVQTRPANWRTPIKLGTAWSTDVSTAAITLAEDRRALWGSPVRNLSRMVTGTDRNSSRELFLRLMRHADQSIYVPLDCDVSVVKQQAIAGSTSLYFDTTYRRFYANRKAIVVRYRAGLATFAREIDISSIFPDHIVMAPMLDDIQGGDLVFPAMKIEIGLTHRMASLNDALSEATLQLSEAIGSTSLPASESSYPPSGFESYLGRPILPADINASSMPSQISRGGRKYESGRGVIVDLGGRRPQVSFDLKFLDETRAKAWDRLRFWDSLQGRRRTFWALAPFVLFDVRAYGSYYIDVDIGDAIEDVQNYIDYVGFQLTDGTRVIREIDTVTVVGNYWRIAFTTPLPATYTPSQVRKVTSAHLVRSATDEMVQTWFNVNTCESAFSVIEQLDDSVIDIENVVPPISFGIPDNIDDLLFWFSAHSNCYFCKTHPTLPNDLKISKLCKVDSKSEDVSIVADVQTESKKFGTLFMMALGASERPTLYQMKKGTAAGRRSFTAEGQGAGNFARFYIGQKVAGYKDYYGGNFWDPTKGMTLVAVWRMKGSTSQTNRLLYKPGVLEWDTTAFQIHPTYNVASPSTTITWANASVYKDDAVGIFMISWKPSTYLKSWKNGVSTGVAASAGASIAVNAAVNTELRIYDETGTDNTEEKDHKFFELINYKRALTVDELNALGTYLAQVYGISWTTIT